MGIIKESRLKHGLTQKEVATECGISQSALSQIESGENIPKLETLYKLSLYLAFPLTAYLDEMGVKHGTGA